MLDGALACARRFVQEVHPEAAASALAGSIAAGRGTATSDLDIVTYYDSQPANYAETCRYDDWLIETFGRARMILPRAAPTGLRRQRPGGGRRVRP